MNHRKNKGYLAARLVLGLIFTLFGAAYFLNLLPKAQHSGAAGAFLGGLFATGYMFPLIKGTELVAGLLLLSGRAVPFALTLLAPIVVNIVAFHLFLEPVSLAIPILTLVLGLYLAWTERNAYAPLFSVGTRERQASAGAGGHATSAA